MCFCGYISVMVTAQFQDNVIICACVCGHAHSCHVCMCIDFKNMSQLFSVKVEEDV